MITYMSDILCITNGNLCKDDFLKRIDQIAACHPAGIVLREKYMPEPEYKTLAAQVLEICRTYHTPCILHSFIETALELNAKAIHLPLPIMRQMEEHKKTAFSCIGASCHSLDDAKEAKKLGCTYITAGHIFETDCKKGLSGRGIPFLQEIVRSVNLPVYAIGGIDEQNIKLIRSAGASGACVMSGAMQCDNVNEYLKRMEGGSCL